MLPTLRQLQGLLAVADFGSFSRAAEKVGVTQPALSASIKELETILGAELVERGARGAVLTPAGVEVVNRARRILADAADLSEAASSAREPLGGSFRLGVIPTIAPFLLPRALPALRQRFTRLKLYLREDLTARLVEGLRDRALDAALIALPYEASGIETAVIAADEFLFISPRNHPLARQARLAPSDLTGEDLLLLEDGHCLRDHALAVCERRPASAGAAMGATSLHTLVQMVANGLGVSLLPRLAADGGVTRGADVEIRAFNEPVTGREIGVAWRQGSARAGEARLLAEAIAAGAGLAPA